MRMICFFLLFLLAGASPFFAHGGEEHADGVFSADEIITCLSLQNGRDACYASLCSDGPGYLCLEEILDAAVPAAGPEKAMMALHDIMKNPDFSISTDGHLLSHVIGRSLSKNFGSTGENFLRCPRDFNNGCFHGFFEDALVTVNDPVAVATSICESMPAGTPYKEKWYCYHGAGHVFMMNEGYDLNRSLEICLSLHEPWPEACWQGVFMENAFRGYENRESNFREDEPLYPCTVVEGRFKRQCYLNHYIYLLDHYSTSLDDLVEACFGAGDFAKPCFAGLALYVSSQNAIRVWDEEFGSMEMNDEEKRVSLCNRFPERYVDVCYHYVILSSLNHDFPSMERVSVFCGAVDESHRRTCFRRIGSYLPNLVSDEAEKAEACFRVPAEYRNECLGVAVEVAETPVSAVSEDGWKFVFPGLSAILKKSADFFPDFFEFLHGGFDGTASGNAAKPVPPDSGTTGNSYANQAPDGPSRLLTPEQDSEKLLYDDDFMGEAIKNYTLRSLTLSLNRLGSETGINCHNRAHELGRKAYELLGGTAFKDCGIECHSGCRHGATEAFFSDKGSANLVENMAVLCEGENTQFGMHQCVHGVGHGLMAWFDYDLPEVLKACDTIGEEYHRRSCYSGVFMENIVGGIAISDSEEGTAYHTTDWLNDDLHYPCNAVDDAYKSECYFLQTDRMLRVLGSIELIGSACSDAPQQFQFYCFYSMGRTVSGFFTRDPAESFRVCAAVEDDAGRETCLRGALSDHLWDETQTDDALELCRLSQNASLGEKCYDQLIVRGSEVIPEASRDGFCKKFPAGYYDGCMIMEPSEALLLSGTEAAFPEIEKTDGAVIRYVNGSYVPDKVHVSAGSKVTWVNQDTVFWPASNLHPTHTAYPGSGITKCFDPSPETLFDACEAMERGAEYSFTFYETGEWRFHDHVNSRATGTVIVSE